MCKVERITGRLSRLLIAALWLLLFCSGCASARLQPSMAEQPFRFKEDTFAFANELNWSYRFDDQGKWTTVKNEPAPDYSLHCFVLARAARQFFMHAQFQPAETALSDFELARRIHQIINRSSVAPSPAAKRIILPAFANLRELSMAKESILKKEAGGAWHSYVQRGHWRMIFPFSSTSQQDTAERCLTELRRNHPPILHLLRFPELSINHAVLLFGWKEVGNEIVFDVYDPNAPDKPSTLQFDKVESKFQFPRNNYFPGGEVKAYEVYRNWLY